MLRKNWKRCSKCKEVKPLSEFYKNYKSKDGKNPHCKQCHRNLEKSYRDARNDWKKEQVRTWKESIAKYDSWAEKIGFLEDIKMGSDGELLVKCTYCGCLHSSNNREVQNRLQISQKMKMGESRLYCSNECKVACPTFGQQTYEKGARVSTSREVPAEFRKIALEDRNWTCEKCGSTEPALHVHHIEGYTELPMFATDLSNVLVLCKKCHKEVHSKPGCRYVDYQCK